jgi:hypothetical protein
MRGGRRRLWAICRSIVSACARRSMNNKTPKLKKEEKKRGQNVTKTQKAKGEAGDQRGVGHSEFM